MRLKVSKRNSKILEVANLSHTPGKGCRPGVPCFKKGECYALKAYMQYPATRKAWDSNLDLWEKDPEEYFKQFDSWLCLNMPKMFRYFVSGDISNKEYLDNMLYIAEMHPWVKFLCFTKRADLFVGFPLHTIPSNLTFVISQWPGYVQEEIPGLPKAWLQDGTETRVPEGAIECYGSCEHCGMCWALPSLGKDVVFTKH